MMEDARLRRLQSGTEFKRKKLHPTFVKQAAVVPAVSVPPIAFLAGPVWTPPVFPTFQVFEDPTWPVEMPALAFQPAPVPVIVADFPEDEPMPDYEEAEEYNHNDELIAAGIEPNPGPASCSDDVCIFSNEDLTEKQYEFEYSARGHKRINCRCVGCGIRLKPRPDGSTHHPLMLLRRLDAQYGKCDAVKTCESPSATAPPAPEHSDTSSDIMEEDFIERNRDFDAVDDLFFHLPPPNPVVPIPPCPPPVPTPPILAGKLQTARKAISRAKTHVPDNVVPPPAPKPAPNVLSGHVLSEKEARSFASLYIQSNLGLFMWLYYIVCEFLGYAKVTQQMYLRRAGAEDRAVHFRNTLLVNDPCEFVEIEVSVPYHTMTILADYCLRVLRFICFGAGVALLMFPIEYYGLTFFVSKFIRFNISMILGAFFSVYFRVDHQKVLNLAVFTYVPHCVTSMMSEYDRTTDITTAQSTISQRWRRAAAPLPIPCADLLSMQKVTEAVVLFMLAQDMDAMSFFLRRTKCLENVRRINDLTAIPFSKPTSILTQQSIIRCTLPGSAFQNLLSGDPSAVPLMGAREPRRGTRMLSLLPFLIFRILVETGAECFEGLALVLSLALRLCVLTLMIPLQLSGRFVNGY